MEVPEGVELEAEDHDDTEWSARNSAAAGGSTVLICAVFVVHFHGNFIPGSPLIVQGCITIMIMNQSP